MVPLGGQDGCKGSPADSGLQRPMRDVWPCRGAVDEWHVCAQPAGANASTGQERIAVWRVWRESVSRTGRVSDTVHGHTDRGAAHRRTAASSGDDRESAGSVTYVSENGRPA